MLTSSIAARNRVARHVSRERAAGPQAQVDNPRRVTTSTDGVGNKPCLVRLRIERCQQRDSAHPLIPVITMPRTKYFCAAMKMISMGVTAIDGNKLTIQFDRAGEKRVVDSFVEKH